MTDLKTPSFSSLKETELIASLFLLDFSESEAYSFYENVVDCIETFAQPYIWNKDKLSFSKPVASSLNKNFFTCTSILEFGDNFEDEWFVVYLLFNITRKFPSKLAAQVVDSDGEFMLIHAANFLPDWIINAESEIMINRVFIFNGDLHIIPSATSPSHVTHFPAFESISEPINAIKTLVSFQTSCKASPEIQNCIRARISKFEPELIPKNFLHRATCIIPAKLGMLLRLNPNLISNAINQFCERELKSAKEYKCLEIFKPENFVAYRVTFTKHLYGKLKHFDFKADRKKYGWPTTVNEINGEKLSQETSDKEFKERSLFGFKLTCAFEALMKSLISNKNKDDSFDNYIKRLKMLGYFKDNIDNSASYNELYEKAKSKFVSDSNTSSSEIEITPNSREHLALKLESFLKDDTKNYAEMLKDELSKSSLDVDDSDDWLCVDPPQLDDYLEMYSRGECSTEYDFQVIAKSIQNFLNQKPKADAKSNQSADFKPIVNEEDEKLIEIDIDQIKQNLKELLTEVAMPNEEKQFESDSFLEIHQSQTSENDVKKLDDKLVNYMSEMDLQLKNENNMSRIKDENELDIDLNLVSNAIESYSSQFGFSGPISNIFKSLGL